MRVHTRKPRRRPQIWIDSDWKAEAKFAQGSRDYGLYLLRQDLHCSGHRARPTRPIRPEGTPGLVPGFTRTGPKGLLVGSTVVDFGSGSIRGHNWTAYRLGTQFG